MATPWAIDADWFISSADVFEISAVICGMSLFKSSVKNVASSLARRDGDVAKTGVEQVRVNAGIGIDQDVLGGESLGAVTGDGIPVIKVAMFFWIEFNLTIVFESADDAAIRIDPFNHRKVAIGDAKRPIGCGELDAFADTELAVDLSLSATTLKLFGARIDGTEVDLWRLRPVKHHAPRHECQNAFASVAVEPHDWLNAFR